MGSNMIAPAGIKSIQRGSTNLTMSGGGKTGSATITAVNVDKTVVDCSVGDYPGTSGSIYLTNSTTLSFSVGSDSSSGVVAVKWQVVEYY